MEGRNSKAEASILILALSPGLLVHLTGNTGGKKEFMKIEHGLLQ